VYNVRTILLSIQSLLGGAPHTTHTTRDRARPTTRRIAPPRSCILAHALRGIMQSLLESDFVACPCVTDPNLDSPLNGHAASIWNNVPEYKKALLKHKSAHSSSTAQRA